MVDVNVVVVDDIAAVVVPTCVAPATSVGLDPSTFADRQMRTRARPCATPVVIRKPTAIVQLPDANTPVRVADVRQQSPSDDAGEPVPARGPVLASIIDVVPDVPPLPAVAPALCDVIKLPTASLATAIWPVVFAAVGGVPPSCKMPYQPGDVAVVSVR